MTVEGNGFLKRMTVKRKKKKTVLEVKGKKRKGGEGN